MNNSDLGITVGPRVSDADAHLDTLDWSDPSLTTANFFDPESLTMTSINDVEISTAFESPPEPRTPYWGPIELDSGRDLQACNMPSTLSEVLETPMDGDMTVEGAADAWLEELLQLGSNSSVTRFVALPGVDCPQMSLAYSSESSKNHYKAYSEISSAQASIRQKVSWP